MYQLAHVANTILYRSRSENMSVSPMKLQKLIYFLYAEYLYSERKHLFTERFEPWKYGPVLSDVYQAFKQYGARNIKKFMPDASGDYRIIDDNYDFQFKLCFDKIWCIYAPKTGIELSVLSHDPYSAWYVAVQNQAAFLSDDDILKEMERRNGRGQTRESSLYQT